MKPHTPLSSLSAILVAAQLLSSPDAAAEPAGIGPPTNGGSHRRLSGRVVRLSARVALERALEKSPELGPGRLLVRDTASLRPSAARHSWARPVVAAEGGMRRNPAGDSRPEISVSLTQAVPLTSIGDARRRHADALLTEAHAELERDSLGLAVEVLDLWLDLAHWERVAEHHGRAVERAQRSSDLIAQQVALGSAQPGDDAVALAALGRSRAARRHAQAQCERAVGELQLLLDADPTEKFVTEGELGLPEPTGPDVEVTRHPSTQLLLAQAQQQRSTAQLELAQARAPLGVGAQVTREGTGDWVALLHVSAPLPFGDPNRYWTLANGRQLEALEFEARHTRERFTRLAAQLRRRWDFQRRQVEQIEKEEVAPAAFALRVTEYQFEAAKVPLQTLLLSRDRVADAEMNSLLARLELERLRLQLAWADGSLLDWARSSR